MNKKAFTLIELLGSIAILAMIALVAFPSVLNLINNSQNKIDKSMEDYVISSAREYVNDHVNVYPKKNGKHSGQDYINNVSICTLIKDGYIDSKLINKEKNSEMLKDKIDVYDVSVEVEVNGSKKTVNKYEFKYKKSAITCD